MTEEQIKEMLNGIINNGEKWECKPNYKCDIDGCGICRYKGYCDWRPYKLGDKIHDDWEYRKVETWYVYKVGAKYKRFLIKSGLNDNILFSGTKEGCDKWIEEHSTKTWLEDYLESNYGENAQYYIKIGTTEVCKKILEEMENRALSSVSATTLRNIFKDLGVEL